MENFYCGPCKIQLNSKVQWDQHLTGGKHLRAFAISQPSKAFDMSAAIALPNGNFKCKTCDDFVCSGLIPLEQHLSGQKHFKNVQRGRESTQSNPGSPAKSPISVMSSLVHSPPATAVNNNDSSPTTAANGSSALPQPDGSYKCKVCAGFTCSGPIPMQDHLKGKSHLKNLNNSSARKIAFEQLNISSTPEPTVDYVPSSLSVDKRIEKAWNHQTICGYNYDENFSNLSIEKKIEVLNPHFAFIGKDEPMPNFVKYLSM